MITFTVKIETVDKGTGLSVKSEAEAETEMEIMLAAVIGKSLEHAVIFLNKMDPENVEMFGNITDAIRDSAPKPKSDKN